MKLVAIIGFWVEDIEETPGIHKPSIIEKKYYCDCSKAMQRWQQGDEMNSEIKINNTISILSDIFMMTNLKSIKYAIWNGMKLTVTSITVNYPRITLELGGFYNDQNV